MIDRKAREKQLRERLAELEGRLHRIEDHLEQPPDSDWEDNAIESEMDQVLEGLGHAGNAEIQAIYAALARLKGGIYGVCARCGEDISEERLNSYHIPPCVGPVRARSRRRSSRPCIRTFVAGEPPRWTTNSPKPPKFRQGMMQQEESKFGLCLRLLVNGAQLT